MKKNLFTALLALHWAAFSYAEDEALDGPEAAASIIEADPSGDVKSALRPTEMPASAGSDTVTSIETEEEPSLDESEYSIPSGEDFFVVEPPSDLSAPDVPDNGETTLEMKG